MRMQGKVQVKGAWALFHNLSEGSYPQLAYAADNGYKYDHCNNGHWHLCRENYSVVYAFKTLNPLWSWNCLLSE